MNIVAASPVDLLHAVSDSTRLRLLRALMREELNVQELVRVLESRQPSVSRHLAVLRKAGWVEQRREGTYSWYRATPTGSRDGREDLRRVVGALADALPEARGDDERLATVIAERDERARELFAGVVDHWDRVRRQYEHPDLQAGVVGALVPAGLRVLDVGTGSGALLPLLAGAGARVTAVDHSAGLLARATRRSRDAGHPGIAFAQADVRDLPFVDGGFDAAYSSMVLHHLRRPDAAIVELARVVRPGGRVVIVEFTRHNLVWMRDQLAHHWLGFDPEQLEAWLAAAGLRTLRRLRRRRTARDEDIETVASGREGFAWPDVIMTVTEKT
ncbi:metalloregulator ArsR/SmtB family transcription factor [bacterium]|nr:metalloregulator ArsR/SmtB family transcription factor [bacterium]